MMYLTLDNDEYSLDALDAEEQRLYQEVKRRFDTDMDAVEFTNFWMGLIRKQYESIERAEIVALPLYKICQDLESRLAIRQGYAKEPDYRDLLADAIDMRYTSRYQFCKETGMDQGYLSSVLNKKKNTSFETFQRLLVLLNCRIAIIDNPSLTGTNSVKDGFSH